MLEPSFLHPGTLSALPDAWKAFAVAVVEAEQQVGVALPVKQHCMGTHLVALRPYH